MASGVLGTLKYIIGAKTTDLERGLKKSEGRVNKFSTNVQRSIGKAMRQAGSAIAGAFAIQQLVSSAVRSIKEFDQSIANLAAILGGTRDDIRALEAEAKRLGSTTAFTAGEVAGLQTEFAKLGFTKEEIMDVTEATLQLAAASGTDLARAAQVAGATVRGFNLDASETQRVVDVMAKSFTSSALDMEKFAVAMRVVGPVANSAGLSLERTTAMLGTLVDRGMDASTAGTSLRMMLLRLTKEGVSMSEAFDHINNSVDRNEAAMKYFDARTVTTANILAGATEQTGKFTKSLLNAAGTAQEMAEVQLDTLTGRLTILKSAWEGFILSLDAGEGKISTITRNVIDLTTALLNMATATEDTGDLSDLMSAFEVQRQVASDAGQLKKAIQDYERATGKALTPTQRMMIYLRGVSEEFVNTVQGYRDAQVEAEKYGRVFGPLNSELATNDILMQNMQMSQEAASQAMNDNTDSITDQTKAVKKAWEEYQNSEHYMKLMREEMALLAKEADYLFSTLWDEDLFGNDKPFSEIVFGKDDKDKKIRISDFEVDPEGMQSWEGDMMDIDHSVNLGILPGLQAMEERLANMQVIGGMLGNIFDDMASEDPFGAMIESIKGLIAQLAQAAALSLILSLVTGGISNFGKIFGGMTGFSIPKAAKGGITTGPTLAMVGDNPSGKEAIIPLEKMGQIFGGMQGGGTGGGRLTATVSGTDLKFVLDRTNQDFNRFN